MKTLPEKKAQILNYLVNPKSPFDHVRAIDVIKNNQFNLTQGIQLFNLWKRFGIEKSLNEIFYSPVGIHCSYNNRFENGAHTCSGKAKHTEQFKDKATQELFDFLYNIFLINYECNKQTHQPRSRKAFKRLWA